MSISQESFHDVIETWVEAISMSPLLKEFLGCWHAFSIKESKMIGPHLSSLYLHSHCSFYIDQEDYYKHNQQDIPDHFKENTRYMNDMAEEEDLSLLPDGCTIQSTKDKAHHIKLEVDIALDPTYQMPCFYIYACSSNGEPCSSDTLLAILPTLNLRLPLPESHSFLQRTFSETEHPCLGRPCLCLHICGLPELFSSMQRISFDRPSPSPINPSISTVPSTTSSHSIVNNASGSSCVKSEKLFLLHWFSRVGYIIGLNVTPEIYLAISKILLEQ
eukprot:gene6877-13945_t